MTGEAFWSLVRQTLFEPREAARVLMAMRLPQEVLWQALALMSVLYTIVYTLSLRMTGPVDASEMLMPAVFQAPVILALALFGGLALTVIAVRAIGQAIGGTGETADVLVLITWLQVLRLMVQVGVLVLALGSPPLAGMAAIVVAVWGLYIFINFVDAAHGFENRLKAFGAIILSVFAMVMGLSAILSLAGIVLTGGQ
ncbi:MAG: YIP1 family protein [Roseovarius sp.]|nr:YIP1 family protein [Roseovarius sp.]